jgi:hypothetical protein
LSLFLLSLLDDSEKELEKALDLEDLEESGPPKP